MLAKIDWNAAPCDAPVLPDYSGFPFWEAFVAEPNKERKVCDFLHEKLGIDLYWPHYTVQLVRRGRVQMPSPRAVLPCVVLAPIEYLAGSGRDRILDWLHLRPLRLARPLTKDEIEMLREIEGRLNMRYQRDLAVAGHFEVGQRARFRNDVYAEKLGDVLVTKVASAGRISIKVDGKLFGGKRDMVVSAVELEAM